MVMTRLNNANVFATLPFDQIDGIAGFYVHEDFEQAALLADLVDGTGVTYDDAGHTLWHGAEIAGGAVSNITVPVSVADHVGIISLKVGSTIPADGDAASLQYGGSAVGVQDTYLPDNNGAYIATVIRIADVSDTIAEFGWCGQTPEVPNAGALDIVALTFDPEDAVNVDDKLFISQINDNNSDVEDALSEAKYVENDWVLLEIGLDDTGAQFRVTTEDVTETNNIAGTINVAMRPYFAVENKGAAEEVLDIDLFHLRYLRRDALVGQANDWLGA